MRAVFVLVPALLVASARPAVAVVEQDRSVFGGAGRSISGNLELELLVGDIAVGPSADATLELWHGFWAPLPASLVSVPPATAPATAFLAAPAPHPATEIARVRFGLARPGRVTLTIHDVAGRNLRTLVSGPREPGPYTLTWDLRDDAGRHLPSGLYYLRLDGDSFRASRKVVVLSPGE